MTHATRHVPERPEPEVGGGIGDGTQHKLDGMDHLVHHHFTELKLLVPVPPMSPPVAPVPVRLLLAVGLELVVRV